VTRLEIGLLAVIVICCAIGTAIWWIGSKSEGD
jgi:predicted signal transduction protein with EAL and GGDEF domain